MTYSVHFRKKVLLVKERKELSFTALSKKFNIGRNTIFSWTKKLYPQKHRDKKAIKIDPDKLVQDVKEYKDAYQYERDESLGALLHESDFRYSTPTQNLGLYNAHRNWFADLKHSV